MNCSSVGENVPAVLELELGEIAAGHGHCFVVGGRQIAVFRLRDGRVFALDNVCPHRSGPLSEGIVGTDFATREAAVICPLHSYKFSLRDGRGLNPTELQVRSYPVEIRDGRVTIHLG